MRVIHLGVSERRGGEGGHIHDHLLAAEERVADEFAGAQRYGLLAVCHICGSSKGVSAVEGVGRWNTG